MKKLFTMAFAAGLCFSPSFVRAEFVVNPGPILSSPVVSPAPTYRNTMSGAPASVPSHSMSPLPASSPVPVAATAVHQGNGGIASKVPTGTARAAYDGIYKAIGNPEKATKGTKGVVSSGAFIFVLQDLLPRGWTGIVEAEVADITVDTVDTTENWTIPLRRLLEINALQGFVDTPAKKVFVRKGQNSSGGAVPPPVAMALAEAEKKSSPPPSPQQNTAYKALTASAPISPVPAVLNPGMYAIVPGSLYMQLQEWCQRAGYQLIWTSKNDFIIQGQKAFGAEFEESIVNLFAILYKEGRLSLKAQMFKGNNVLRVRED